MTCKHGADHKETFCRDAFCGHSNNEELDRLKAENARLREALIELSHSEVIKNDPESYEIVGEALKGAE